MVDGPTQTDRIEYLVERLGELERHLSDRLDTMHSYVDKTLNQASLSLDALHYVKGRQYFALDNKWGLSHLDDGSPFFVNTEDRNITPWILMGGTWEPNITRVLTAYTQPGMRAIDIGANMGYFTVKLGKLIGQHGQLYAFDPNPEVVDVCLENIKINGLAGTISLHALALGDRAGKATLTRSKSNMASANLMGDQDADVSFEVEVTTLDQFFDGGPPFDLIKLDAEGYEIPILNGGSKLIERSPDVAIMVEVGLERWERHAPISSLFDIAGPGKAAYVVDDEGRLTRHQEADEVRSYLMGRPYHEAYYFVGSPELIEHRLSALIAG